MQAATRRTAAGQRHVKRLLGQPGRKRPLPNCLATKVEGRLDSILGAIDRRARGFSLLGRQFGHTLEQFSDPTALAKVNGFDLLKCVRVVGHRKGSRRCLDNLIEVVHGSPKKRRLAPPFFETPRA
jgi:hypothetical protein